MVIDVDLDASPASVTLIEPDDTKRFHIAVRGTGTAAALDAALTAADAGRLNDEGEAFIAVVWVRSAAAGHVGDGWEADFDGMLAYARSKGWLDEAGSEIQAHAEWSRPFGGQP